MKVALIEVKPTKSDYIAKEMGGGLGKTVKLGDNLVGSILRRALQSFFNAPPIVLANLAAICRQNDHEVKAYHVADAGQVDAQTGIAIVLSSMVDYHNEVRFIKELKALRPDLRVIVVGSFASAMPQIYSQVADCVVTGSPETALQSIFKEGIPAETVIHTEDPEDLNTLPMVDWAPFLANGAYAKRPFSRKLGVSIQKSRGCSMTCNYCPYASFYGNVRHFNSDYVLNTIRFYYENHGIRYFMFRDPNFGERPKDFQAFMNALIQSKLDISWSCEARLDTFTDDDLRLMREAGLSYLTTGVESSDAAILKANLRRAYKKDDTFRKIDVLERSGVIVQTNYILGFPHESEKSVFETIEYAKQLNSMFAAFHVFTPQPGTKIFEDYKHKLSSLDWEDFTYSHLVWQHDTLSKEFLDKAVTQAHLRYYVRPNWILKHTGRLLKISVSS